MVEKEKEKISVFGIRHHGPGSARSLVAGLEKLQPDCILIEGPPEANELVKHVISDSMKPPVSLLIYAQDDLKRAVYYPFAVFSPEWQALVFGTKRQIPVRFMDLPQSHWIALSKIKEEKYINELKEALGRNTNTVPAEADSIETSEKVIADSDAENAVFEPEEGASFANDIDLEENESEDAVDELAEEAAATSRVNEARKMRGDPLSYLAQAAGYDDSERWWENLVEHRREDLDVFTAINEAMTTLRTELREDELFQDEYEPMREAHMRQTIRAAVKEGFQNIAVICGAWHVPALQKLPPAKDDQALLKGLAKVKVESTWIPWTHARLSFESGYGAGVESPGWYHHLWTCQSHVLENWLTVVARLLRAEDLDASSAHIIETVRLAETLSSMRGQPLPGLREISEAVQAVFCHGNDFPMQIIYDKLIVGDLMGEVPPELPGTPLQKSVEQEQKRLRIPAQAGEKVYDLDLRNANDLARSHLLHRLLILGIDWGTKEEVSGKSGSFHEVWRVRWMPEYVIKLIEHSVWGKSTEEAASAFASAESDKLKELALLISLLDKVLLADLPAAVDHVMHRVQTEAAVAVDVKHLMQAFPALVQVARYGNVRKTDVESVAKILEGLLSRICIGLPPACSSLNDDAADEMFELLLKVHSSVGLLQKEEHTTQWLDAMQKIAEAPHMNGLLAGRCCRILFDKRKIDSTEAARRFGLALSTAGDPTIAASWADGFLRGSGAILIHDMELFSVVDSWVIQLNEDGFTQILPLLRRTFSTYAPPERRQIGERVARLRSAGVGKAVGSALISAEFDQTRAEKILPVFDRLFGLSSAGAVVKNEDGK